MSRVGSKPNLVFASSRESSTYVSVKSTNSLWTQMTLGSTSLRSCPVSNRTFQEGSSRQRHIVGPSQESGTDRKSCSALEIFMGFGFFTIRWNNGKHKNSLKLVNAVSEVVVVRSWFLVGFTTCFLTKITDGFWLLELCYQMLRASCGPLLTTFSRPNIPESAGPLDTLSRFSLLSFWLPVLSTQLAMLKFWTDLSVHLEEWLFHITKGNSNIARSCRQLKMINIFNHWESCWNIWNTVTPRAEFSGGRKISPEPKCSPCFQWSTWAPSGSWFLWWKHRLLLSADLTHLFMFNSNLEVAVEIWTAWGGREQSSQRFLIEQTDEWVAVAQG